MKKIAIIGGGFAGIAVAANLVNQCLQQSQEVKIYVFEPQRIWGGPVFAPTLPDSYRLNHESSNMGVANPHDSTAGLDDFFNWLQDNLHTPLEQQGNQTIAERYAAFDLTNPHEYLPRSLYGHYLSARFTEMLALPPSASVEVRHVRATVEQITKQGKRWLVHTAHSEAAFDLAVLCTGYRYSGDAAAHNLLKSQHPDTFLHSRRILEAPAVAVIGTSLSAIEAALALADEGQHNITMYSRGGRLPKVRGTFAHREQPFTIADLDSMLDTEGHLPIPKLLTLLKNVFDAAYPPSSPGHYQEEGIKWQAVLSNQGPIEQLREDIQKTASGQELPWRSALISLFQLQIPIWNRIATADKKKLLADYSTLLLTYLAPIPLPQAQRLLTHLEQGHIRIVAGTSSYIHHEQNFTVTCHGEGTTTYPYLIDARGPAKDATHPLITALLQANILAKHPLAGIQIVQETFETRSPSGAPNAGLYAVGPMTYGERPLQTATFFFSAFARTMTTDAFERYINASP